MAFPSYNIFDTGSGVTSNLINYRMMCYGYGMTMGMPLSIGNEFPIHCTVFQHNMLHQTFYNHNNEGGRNQKHVNSYLMAESDSNAATRLTVGSQCDFQSQFSQSLKSARRLRIKPEEKPFKCPFCNRGFCTLSSRKIHMRTHTGEKPHKCKTCGRAFADGSSLIKHRRIHTGEKPFKCHTCNVSFSQSGNLKRHMRTCIHKANIEACEQQSN